MDLISLIEEAWRQRTIESMAWLLLILLRQVCKKNKQVGQEDTARREKEPWESGSFSTACAGG